jgi:alkylhydroperoxidase family enzyme
MPRLEPVDRPPTLFARAAQWVMRRRLGRVITPARVVYDRVPALYRVAVALIRAEQKGLTLPAETALLLKTHAALLNSCGFCVDIARAQAVQERLSLEKFEALADFETSPLFPERERAALAYVAEVTRRIEVDDRTFERLRKSWSEREVVEITWLAALEAYYNRIARPLRIESDGLCSLALARRGKAA